MATRRHRVVIDGEPFVLRSAVFSCLKDDPRFDVTLADALGSSSDGVVLIVEPDGPMSLRLRDDDAVRPVPYPGMRDLADTLARELDSGDAAATKTDTRAPENN